MDQESAWIEEARRGSADAFGRLVQLHHVRVRAYISRFVWDRDMVDDVAQEVFLEAFRSMGSYSGVAPFNLWLLSIARSRALMCLRKERARRAGEGNRFYVSLARAAFDRMESEGAGPPEVDRRMAKLKACLGELVGPGADLLKKYYFEGRDALEIAREMGKKKSAVWMALLRIREALRRCVEAKLSAMEEGS